MNPTVLEFPRIGSSSKTQTPKKWSFFMKAKNELTEKVTPFLKKIKTTKKMSKWSSVKMKAKRTLEENCTRVFQEISFEFTSVGTPQQNGVIEQGFLIFIPGCAR